MSPSRMQYVCRRSYICLCDVLLLVVSKKPPDVLRRNVPADMADIDKLLLPIEKPASLFALARLCGFRSFREPIRS